MRRFYVDQKSVIDNIAYLSETESRHISSVLRLQPGTPVQLFDGTGILYDGELRTVTNRTVTVIIMSKQIDTTDRTVDVSIFQSLLKGKKMDFLVQKCTELGVHTFHPLVTRYSENRKGSERQAERWQRIMLEACKQCKRSTPMTIGHLSELAHSDFSSYSTKLLFWEEERSRSLETSLFAAPGYTCLVLGPEGGFHEEEITRARDHGFITVSLGSRILRAETASIAAVSIVQFLTGSLTGR